MTVRPFVRPVSSLVVLAGLLLSACSGGGDGEPPSGTSLAVLSANDVVVAAADTIASGPRIAGTLEPAQKAVIRAEASGSVLEVHVDLGQVVAEGELLGKIEASGSGDLWRSAKSGVTSAEQELKNAERDLERARRLAGAGAVSPRDLEVSESQHAGAQARLEAARAQQSSAGEQLGRTTVKSPIAGVVSERAVNVGDVVSPGAPMFTVIEPSSLRLQGSVPASAVGTLQIGTPVTFEVQGYAGRTFDGTVERIAPAVDPATRQIPILVSIPNEGHTLIAGLFAEGRVATEQRQGLVVPVDAVDTTGPVPFVLRVKDGKVERAEVALGVHDEAGELYEITSGVDAGDTLIIGGARDVAPGSPVRIEDQGAASSADAGAEG